jgi:hypothetical protein
MTANPQLVKERDISHEDVARINNLHRELETCLVESDDYLRETPRGVIYHWFEGIEIALHQLWGFPCDTMYHTWKNCLTERYRQLDYVGVTYRCPATGMERTVEDKDVTTHKNSLFGVGNGFIDFAGYNVRIVGNLERLA